MPLLNSSHLTDKGPLRIRLWAIGVVCLVALAGAAGCQSAFEPFTETDMHFTILGYLDTDAPRQFVRVIPFRPVVERLFQEKIDVTVRSIDLTSGNTAVWQDSVVHFPDSSYGHVFWSQFSAVPGHKYRIELERSDGSLTWAETVVPEFQVDPDSVYGALNENADFAPLFWPGVQNVIGVDVLYDIGPYSCSSVVFPPKVYGRYEYRLPYEGDAQGRWTGKDWRVDLHLWADRDTVMTRLRSLGVPVSIPFCAELYRLEVRLATPSDEFNPPGGVWDRELLIQPGTFTNVHGGLGFFGSVVRTHVDWTLSTLAQNSLGYTQE